jgi:hypothetical protein
MASLSLRGFGPAGRDFPTMGYIEKRVLGSVGRHTKRGGRRLQIE